MPCPLCESVYSPVPCKGDIKNIVIIDDLVTIYNRGYTEIMFTELNNECPCITCLVKSICLKKRLDCKIYKTFLYNVSLKWGDQVKKGGEV